MSYPSTPLKQEATLCTGIRSFVLFSGRVARGRGSYLFSPLGAMLAFIYTEKYVALHAMQCHGPQTEEAQFHGFRAEADARSNTYLGQACFMMMPIVSKYGVPTK